MKYLSILLALVFVGCAGQDLKVGAGYGQATKLHSAKHDKPGDHYDIETIMVHIDKLEINLNKHEYNVHLEDKFSNLSVGAKYHFAKKWDWFVVDAGLGFKWTETDDRNKWLEEKPIIADFSLSTGIEKEFKGQGWKIQAFYEFQHLSTVGDDQGMNLDKIVLLFLWGW